MLSRTLSSNSLATSATSTIKSLCVVNDDEPGEEEEEEEKESNSLPQKYSGIIKPQRVIIGFSLNFGGSDTQFTCSNHESESKNDISSSHENNSMISPRSVLDSYCEEEEKEENDTMEEDKSAKVQTLATTNITTTSTMKMSTNHHTKSSISALGKSLLLSSSSSSSSHPNDNKKLEEISGEKEENSEKMKKSEAENPCGHTSTKSSICDLQFHDGAGMTVVTNPGCEGILLRNGYNFNSSKAKSNVNADTKSRICGFSRVLCPTLGIHFDEADREGEEEAEEEECGSDDDDDDDDDAISDGNGDFLRACFHCKRHLKQGKDIFMYRGDRAFCSSECREHHIAIDTRSAKVEQIGHNHI